MHLSPELYEQAELLNQLATAGLTISFTLLLLQAYLAVRFGRQIHQLTRFERQVGSG